MAKAILIANFDKADQKGIEKILKSPDFRLIFSDTEDDALMQTKLFKPDLIIAWAKWKEKIGVQLCSTIKSDPELNHIPFVLLLNIFEQVPEREREQIKADGIIYKPLHEEEVLNMVNHLIEEDFKRGKEKEISKREMEWKSFADNLKPLPGKKEELLLDESGGIEEEIIELVDVVEEPESKMSIHDLVGTGKEEPLGEVTPLDSWERIEEKEKPSEKGFKLFPNEKEAEGLIPSSLKKDTAIHEDASKEELFEKVELKEIFEKKGRPGPSPKPTTFEEFEAALQKGEGTKPLKVDREISFEEEFPEELFEEIREEEISAVKEPKKIKKEEISLKELEPLTLEMLERRTSPPIQLVEKQIGEMISKGIREMMEEMNANLIPEVTQKMIHLTLERIERIVREIVPDLTEKVIREEIQRLQKGEKD